MEREWRCNLEDMIGFCERVLRFTTGISRADFATEPMRYDATVRNMELIVEAATHVPAAIRQATEKLPW